MNLSNLINISIVINVGENKSKPPTYKTDGVTGVHMSYTEGAKARRKSSKFKSSINTNAANFRLFNA